MNPPTRGRRPEDSVRLNLRQKLAEVRRRIGYIQKRGHNERFNYSYVTAADIAGSVGDILSELGVVVIPSLENITYESAPGRGETTRMAQVVMAYTFSDVDSGEGDRREGGGPGPRFRRQGALQGDDRGLKIRPAPVVPAGHRRRSGRRTDGDSPHGTRVPIARSAPTRFANSKD